MADAITHTHARKTSVVVTHLLRVVSEEVTSQRVESFARPVSNTVQRLKHWTSFVDLRVERTHTMTRWGVLLDQGVSSTKKSCTGMGNFNFGIARSLGTKLPIA